METGHTNILRKNTKIQSVFQIFSGYNTTCLFTGLEEYSLVPAGFLTAQFMPQKKHSFRSLCFDGRTKMEFLFIASMEQKKWRQVYPSSF